MYNIGCTPDPLFWEEGLTTYDFRQVFAYKKCFPEKVRFEDSFKIGFEVLESKLES